MAPKTFKNAKILGKDLEVAASQEIIKPLVLPTANTLAFYMDDFPKTLFPLKTNKELAQRGEQELKDHVSKCLDVNEKSYSFLPQTRVYAAKPKFHLRRTVKLDPVAEYFIYDIVFKNRNLFRKPHTLGRTHYGYRFENGTPITPTAAYKAFKTGLAEYGKKYSYSMSFDVASYFNNIYHHDIVSWFAELNADDADAAGLGQFLREIRSGRSTDCLPQGIYPAKMIGNDFLRFIDNYHGLKSEKFLRFMDDIYLFSNEQSVVENDFQIIQKLLGEKGLSVNPQKTKTGPATHVEMDSEIDQIKGKLLKRRRYLLTIGYDEAGEEIVKEHLQKWPLSNEELKYIDAILEKSEIEEDDVELILTIMGDHTSKIEAKLPYIISTYPHLIKNVHTFCSRIENKETISQIILEEIKSKEHIMEFQLFWFGSILDDHLMKTTNASKLIENIFQHKSATNITKAKILEIADLKFGLPDLRNEFLVSGQSDWLAWSAAVGSRALKPITRNHKLKYFGNSSNMNHLIAKIMMK